MDKITKMDKNKSCPNLNPNAKIYNPIIKSTKLDEYDLYWNVIHFKIIKESIQLRKNPIPYEPQIFPYPVPHPIYSNTFYK